tara:strand:- start:1266 stop:2048 length:783 start_codon:yes stop_codon:yes gene_type:complete
MLPLEVEEKIFVHNMDYKSLLGHVYDHASEESTSFITINTSTLRLQAEAPLPHPPATLVPFSVSWEATASIALRRHVIDAIKEDLPQNDELRIVIQRCDLTSLDDVHVLVVHAARKANGGDKEIPVPATPDRSVEAERNDEERRVDTSGSGKPPVPISDLPMSCGTLVFKGKVSRKGEIKMYSSGTKEVFSFVVSDASGEIEVVAFSGACRKFFACLENGKEYVFRAGKLVRVEDGDRFSMVEGQTHKVILKETTKIEEA